MRIVTSERQAPGRGSSRNVGAQACRARRAAPHTAANRALKDNLLHARKLSAAAVAMLDGTLAAITAPELVAARNDVAKVLAAIEKEFERTVYTSPLLAPP